MVDILFKPEDKVKSKEEKKHCKEKLFITYFKQLLYEDADAVRCIEFVIFKKKKVFILVVLSLRCCMGFTLVVASRGHFSSWQCPGFSFQALLLLQSTGSWASFSSCGSRALEHRLNSCDSWAQLLCNMWDLPRSGIGLTSSALAGRFFTTEPPGKLQSSFYIVQSRDKDFKGCCC